MERTAIVQLERADAESGYDILASDAYVDNAGESESVLRSARAGWGYDSCLSDGDGAGCVTLGALTAARS